MKYNTFAIMLFASVLPAQLTYAAQTCHTTMEESTPTSRFTLDNSNGTIIDTATNLMWKSCLDEQTWNTNACNGALTTYTWQEALDFANSHTYATHSDWRVPNIKELMSIVESRCYGSGGSAINQDVFKSSINGVWTSSPYLDAYPSSKEKAVWVNFYYGDMNNGSKSLTNHIRLVRDNN